MLSQLGDDRAIQISLHGDIKMDLQQGLRVLELCCHGQVRSKSVFTGRVESRGGVGGISIDLAREKWEI
jgi:hypothetical protein